jgi:N-acyl-D-glutamate deacylase
MAWSTKVGTDKEIEKILSLLDQGLKDGALGIGHVPGYMVDGVTSGNRSALNSLLGNTGVS